MSNADIPPETKSQEYVADTGVVITTMPTFEMEPQESPHSVPPISVRSETRMRETSAGSTDRISKLEGDLAEQRYQERRSRISHMLKSAVPSDRSAEPAANVSPIKAISDEEKRSPEQKPCAVPKREEKTAARMLSSALEKSNNSLRYSAEMRIAQIYKNANQIIQSLDKLKNPVSPAVTHNKPVIVRCVPVNPASQPEEKIVSEAKKKAGKPSEEESILQEISKLDSLLQRREKVRGQSVKMTPVRSLASPHKDPYQRIASFSCLKPSSAKAASGTVQNLSSSELQRIAKNRSLVVPSPAVHKTVAGNSTFCANVPEPPGHRYSQGKIFVSRPYRCGFYRVDKLQGWMRPEDGLPRS